MKTLPTTVYQLARADGLTHDEAINAVWTARHPGRPRKRSRLPLPLERYCQHAGVDAELVGRCDSRVDAVVRERDRLWYWMRHNTDYSYPEIGSLTGHHHSSVITGVRRETKRLKEKTP